MGSESIGAYVEVTVRDGEDFHDAVDRTLRERDAQAPIETAMQARDNGLDIPPKPEGFMDFGRALYFLKEGRRVARSGWNGKGMWLMLVPEDLAEAVSFQYAALKPAPWIGMRTADEKFVPWLASQTDMLATDWTVVP